MQITLDYRFVSLNEYIDIERYSRYEAAKVKKRETEAARFCALGHLFPPSDYPVVIDCQWFCSNQRTDPDNIQFSIKFILDGFVKAGVLKGDNWRYIKQINNHFSEAQRDYVVVTISPYLEA